MNFRRLIPALFVLMITTQTGCTTALKRAFVEAAGESSEARVVPGSTIHYKSYKAVEIAPIRSDIDRLVDPAFLRTLPLHLRTALTQRGDGDAEPPFPGGSPTLRIEPEISWYHVPGSLGDILGKNKYAVVLYWLYAEDRPLGKVMVVTKSGASRTDGGDLAESNTRELADWFLEPDEKKREQMQKAREEERKRQEKADKREP